MLITNRIVPVLLLEDGLLVKTQRFQRPLYVGDPINAVKIFNEKEVDEVVILDRDAARGGEPNLRLIEEIASEAFMPLAYGGGIRTVDRARLLVSAGVEKVVVTSSAIEHPDLIPGLARELGSQAIVGGIDYTQRMRKRVAVIRGGTRRTRHTPDELAASLVSAGVGEILLQSVDRDGTMSGMDLEVIRQVAAAISVPLLAVGGAASVEDLEAALSCGASAAGAGAMFVFHGKHRAVLITYPSRAADVTALRRESS